MLAIFPQNKQSENETFKVNQVKREYLCNSEKSEELQVVHCSFLAICLLECQGSCLFATFYLDFLGEKVACNLTRDKHGKNQVYESTVLQVLMKRLRFVSY